MRYKLLYDLHTHTTFSHGKGSIEDNVKVAIEKGLKAIAITDHGPGHLTYGIKREAIPIMRKQIDLQICFWNAESKKGTRSESF